MPRKSAGLLLYKKERETIFVLLVHPGGPYWSRKDAGAWSIPKGEYAGGEQAEAAARREFLEETGQEITCPFVPLGEIRQAGGKLISAFAAEGDLDPAQLNCNTFEMEWPPKSGRMQTFPEVDRAEWFSITAARAKINIGQRAFLDRLAALHAHPAPAR